MTIQSLQISNLQSKLSKEANKSLQGVYNALAELLSYKDIKYLKDDKLSIKSYKEAVRDIKSFQVKLVKARKEANQPYAEISKLLLSFEKDVKGQATKILEELQEEFKPFIEEEKAKKEAFEARRLAKEKALLDDLTKTNESQLSIIEKLKAKNAIKEHINGMLTDTVNAVHNYNLKTLADYKMLLSNKVLTIDLSLFTEEEIEQYKVENHAMVQKCLQMVNEKLVPEADTYTPPTEDIGFTLYTSKVLQNALEAIKNKELNKNEDDLIVFKKTLLEYLNKLLSRIKNR